MSNKPLKGIKVVDFTVAASGPVTSKVLASWGADVIKVEPLEGEFMRHRPFDMQEWENLNKRDMTINLKTEGGLEVMYKLLKTADVFVTNYRTKAVNKLGLDWETVHALNPRLVYGLITGFGEYGPEKDTPGYDTTAYWARTGLMTELVEKGCPPLVNPLSIGDNGLAASMAGAIAAALFEASKTGIGERLSTSLYSFGLWVNQWYVTRPQASSLLSYPASRLETKEPLSNSFKSKDDVWFQMSAFEFNKYFPTVLKICGREDLIGTKGFATAEEAIANAREVTRVFDAGFEKYTWEEIDKILNDANIPHAKFRNYYEVLTDEQAWANNYLYMHTFRDGTIMAFPNTPVRFGDIVAPDSNPCPLLGEHTVDVMHELGYTDEEIQKYVDAKCIDTCHGFESTGFDRDKEGVDYSLLFKNKQGEQN